MALAEAAGSHMRSTSRSDAWYVSVATAPRRVASKNPRSDSPSSGGLVLGGDHAGIRAAAEPQVDALEAESGNDVGRGRPGGDHHALARACHAVARVARGSRCEA